MLNLRSDVVGEVMVRTLLRLGVLPESARHVAASLVQTSLRGVDSHGIGLFPHYCRAVQGGRINHAPKIAVEQTGASTALLDADHAFGHHAGAVAMAWAKRMAAECGLGAVSVRNSSHFGAAAYFALQAPEVGCLGWAFTSADSLVKPFNARTAFLGTNPICFAAPLAREDPLCLDMATSAVSWNKVTEHQRARRNMPPGWAYDEHGMPTIDPSRARMLEPSGSYKGYGLGLMVEILCSVLASGPAVTEILPMYETSLSVRRCISHFFMALDIGRFLPAATFAEHVQSIVDRLRALEGESGDVMVAGDPEKRSAALRRVRGIPISSDSFAEFVALDVGFLEAVQT
jgi:ureidoglycolate dehydrogenase (NAD+)